MNKKNKNTISRAIYYLSCVLETLDMDQMNEINQITETVKELRQIQGIQAPSYKTEWLDAHRLELIEQFHDYLLSMAEAKEQPELIENWEEWTAEEYNKNESCAEDVKAEK